MAVFTKDILKKGAKLTVDLTHKYTMLWTNSKLSTINWHFKGIKDTSYFKKVNRSFRTLKILNLYVCHEIAFYLIHQSSNQYSSQSYMAKAFRRAWTEILQLFPHFIFVSVSGIPSHINTSFLRIMNNAKEATKYSFPINCPKSYHLHTTTWHEDSYSNSKHWDWVPSQQYEHRSLFLSWQVNAASAAPSRTLSNMMTDTCYAVMPSGAPAARLMWLSAERSL
jgi:hypothetical protein